MRKIYLLVFTTLLFHTLSAQWTSNTALNTQATATKVGDAQTIATKDGKTWVAYYKNVPAPKYYEMRAQLLDKDGFQLLGPEGVIVDSVKHSSFTNVFAIAVDANNNLIVALYNTYWDNIYVHKKPQWYTTME